MCVCVLIRFVCVDMFVCVCVERCVCVFISVCVDVCVCVFSGVCELADAKQLRISKNAYNFRSFCTCKLPDLFNTTYLVNDLGHHGNPAGVDSNLHCCMLESPE